MFNPKSTSLIQALEISIDRISRCYSGNWLMYDGVPPAGSSLCSNDSTAAYRVYDRVLEPDNHRFTEIFICIEGNCAIQVEDQIFRVAEGNVVIILPGVLHNELPLKDGNYIAVWITIDADRCMVHLSGKHEDVGFYTVEGQLLQTDYYYNLLLNYIKLELKDKYAYTYELVKTYILQIFIHALRELSIADTPSDHGRLWKQSIVLDIQKYIARNYSKPIRLQEISQEICISENYLNTLFKSAAGKTIMQYISEYKIDKAKFLLSDTRDTVQEIALRLGYYDQYHFSKAFKKATGISPTQFRKA